MITRSYLTRHSRLIPVLIVFAIAFVLRMLVAGIIFRHASLHDLWNNGYEVSHVAASIVNGTGFGSPFGIPSGPTAWPPPLYTYFVACVFRLLGSYSLASAYFLLSVNVFCESLAAGVICYIGETYLGKYVGYVSGLLFALWPGQVLFILKLWDTPFAAVLLPLGVLFYFRLLKSRSRSEWLRWGLLSGFSTMMSPELLLCFAVLTAAAIQDVATLKRALQSVAIAAIILAPWTIRNAVVFHRFVPVRSNFGFELWLGNHEGVGAINDQSTHPLRSPSELARYSQVGEADYLREKEVLSSAFIRRHPSIFISLTFERVRSFWSSPSPWLLPSLLSLVGAALLLLRSGWRIAAPFLSALVVFPFPYYVTHSESWYRHPIDLFILLMCCYFISESCRYLFARPPQIDKPVPSSASTLSKEPKIW
jgi:hypothetical protein